MNDDSRRPWDGAHGELRVCSSAGHLLRLRGGLEELARLKRLLDAQAVVARLRSARFTDAPAEDERAAAPTSATDLARVEQLLAKAFPDSDDGAWSATATTLTHAAAFQRRTAGTGQLVYAPVLPLGTFRLVLYGLGTRAKPRKLRGLSLEQKASRLVQWRTRLEARPATAQQTVLACAARTLNAIGYARFSLSLR